MPKAWRRSSIVTPFSDLEYAAAPVEHAVVAASIAGLQFVFLLLRIMLLMSIRKLFSAACDQRLVQSA